MNSRNKCKEQIEDLISKGITEMITKKDTEETQIPASNSYKNEPQKTIDHQ